MYGKKTIVVHRLVNDESISVVIVVPRCDRARAFMALSSAQRLPTIPGQHRQSIAKTSSDALPDPPPCTASRQRNGQLADSQSQHHKPAHVRSDSAHLLPAPAPNGCPLPVHAHSFPL